VEIVSHSHALHGYVTANPWSDTAPTVTTRRFLPADKRYETRDEYEGRLAADLKESSRRLRAELGHEVSVLAWPYGESNETARRIATSAGFTTTLGLEGSMVEFASLWAGYAQRIMAYRETAIGDSSPGWFQPPPAPVRAAQLDLDDLYDPRAEKLRANVDRAIERLRAIGATDVFLQGLADPGGDGFLQQTYFMNHQTTVRADVWSMVAFRLARERMKPWIRVPSLNLAWEWAFHPEWRVPFPSEAKAGRMVPSYYRVSPDLPEVRKAAVDFYTDLAVYLPIRGVIFDDDAYLRADEPLRGDGTTDPAKKRDAIRGLLDEVKVAVRAWRPQCRFGRVLSPEVAERPGTNPDYAQDLTESLRENDLTVISVAAGGSTNPSDAEGWAERVASSAIANAQAGAAATGASSTTSATASTVKPTSTSAKTTAATSATPAAATSAPKEAPRPPSLLFRVEAYDAARDSWLGSESLQAVVAGLRRGGASHVGVSPMRPDAGNFPAGLLGGPLASDVWTVPTPIALPDSSGSLSVAR
jgi:biofilm PGA synthesis lipoprotein PgaB